MSECVRGSLSFIPTATTTDRLVPVGGDRKAHGICMHQPDVIRRACVCSHVPLLFLLFDLYPR